MFCDFCLHLIECYRVIDFIFLHQSIELAIIVFLPCSDCKFVVHLRLWGWLRLLLTLHRLILFLILSLDILGEAINNNQYEFEIFIIFEIHISWQKSDCHKLSKPPNDSSTSKEPFSTWFTSMWFTDEWNILLGILSQWWKF